VPPSVNPLPKERFIMTFSPRLAPGISGIAFALCLAIGLAIGLALSLALAPEAFASDPMSQDRLQKQRCEPGRYQEGHHCQGNRPQGYQEERRWAETLRQLEIGAENPVPGCQGLVVSVL
jgi:hypothetical protein